MTTIWIQPTGGALGADVHGVDLSQPVSDTAFKTIAEAWSEHLVLRFPGQKIRTLDRREKAIMDEAERLSDADDEQLANTPVRETLNASMNILGAG